MRGNTSREHSTPYPISRYILGIPFTEGCHRAGNDSPPEPRSVPQADASERDEVVEMAVVNCRETFTTNMKKNINKLKAQAQAIMSTEDSPPPPVPVAEEEGEDDDLSDEEGEDNEEYGIQKQGWRVVLSLEFASLNDFLLKLSPYCHLLPAI